MQELTGFIGLGFQIEANGSCGELEEVNNPQGQASQLKMKRIAMKTKTTIEGYIAVAMMIIVIIIFSFVYGCSYKSRTTVNISGEDVRNQFVKGKQINALISREMDMRFMRK